MQAAPAPPVAMPQAPGKPDGAQPAEPGGDGKGKAGDVVSPTPPKGQDRKRAARRARESGLAPNHSPHHDSARAHALFG